MYLQSNIKFIVILLLLSSTCAQLSCSQSNDRHNKALEQQRKLAAERLAMDLRLAQASRSKVSTSAGFPAGPGGFDAIHKHNLSCDQKKK